MEDIEAAILVDVMGRVVGDFNGVAGKPCFRFERMVMLRGVLERPW